MLPNRIRRVKEAEPGQKVLLCLFHGQIWRGRQCCILHKLKNMFADRSPREDNGGSLWPRLPMAETSTGLLRRGQDGTDSDAWQRIVNLYTPLLFGWLRRYSLQSEDAEDLVQEVLKTVSQELSDFEH